MAHEGVMNFSAIFVLDAFLFYAFLFNANFKLRTVDVMPAFSSASINANCVLTFFSFGVAVGVLRTVHVCTTGNKFFFETIIN